MTTTAAFVYLTAHSAKNRVLSRLRRAKNPRYALAMIIGAAYLWLVYLRPQMSSRPAGPEAGVPSSTMWMVVGTAAMLLIAGLTWFIESGPSSLALDDAEAYFILPAPVSRRGLIGYKILRAQLAVLFSVVIWAILMRRTAGTVDWPLRILGIWMFFMTTNLHRTGAELVRAGWSVRGARALRNWAAVLAIVTIIIGIATSLGLNYTELTEARNRSFKELMVALAHALDTGPAWFVLWPIHAILAPMLAPTNEAWLAAAPGAVGVLAAHALWVGTADPRAIDAAVARASDRIAQMRRTKTDVAGAGTSVRPKPDAILKTMPLAPTGWPGTAIIWKNLLCMRRKARPSTLITLMLLPVGLGAIAAFAGEHPLAGLLLGGIGSVLITILAGPLLIRSDLRTDMQNIVALKLLPLSGRVLVASEVLSVVVPLSVVQAGILALTAIGSRFLPETPFGGPELFLLFVAGLPALVAFNAAYVTIQNTAPVLFPAWAKLGAVGGGMEGIGQFVIVAAILLGLMTVALIAPAVIGGGIIFLVRSHMTLGVSGALIAGAAVLAVEVGALILFLGRALERTEPSEVPA